MFSASGLSPFAMLPLASLSLGTVLIEICEKYLRITEGKAEYKTGYSFYLELLAMCKIRELINKEIIKRENELLKMLQFFPREKYMKQVKLNCYKCDVKSIKFKT